MNRHTELFAYDPMCSWCWGFRHPNVTTKLQKRCLSLIDSDQLTIQTNAGGLAIASNATLWPEGNER